jgi:hypothetical protein
MQDTVFAPLIVYMNAEFPGSREIDSMAGSLYERGEAADLPWE